LFADEEIEMVIKGDGADEEEDEEGHQVPAAAEVVVEKEGDMSPRGNEGEGVVVVEKATPVVKIPPRMDGEDPEYPDACFPDHWYEKLPALKGNDESPFWQGWAMLRLKTFRLIENKYFETAVIIMILLSSLALVIKNLPKLKKQTEVFNYFN
jgi:voltage-gated sodium channel type II alpha